MIANPRYMKTHPGRKLPGDRNKAVVIVSKTARVLPTVVVKKAKAAPATIAAKIRLGGPGKAAAWIPDLSIFRPRAMSSDRGKF